MPGQGDVMQVLWATVKCDEDGEATRQKEALSLMINKPTQWSQTKPMDLALAR